MKKIILYVLLGLCILGIIPLALSLTSSGGGSGDGGGSSPSVVTEQTYILTTTSDEHSTIVVYDSENNSVSSLKSGQEYTISVSVDELYTLSTLTLNGISVENNSIFVPTSDINIVSTSSLFTYTLTTTGANCTISVLNGDGQSVTGLLPNQTYTISVTANSGYQIDSITLNGASVENNSTFTATQNTTINVACSMFTLSVAKVDYMIGYGSDLMSGDIYSYMKIGSAPTSNSDYDYCSSSLTATPISASNGTTCVYVWGGGYRLNSTDYYSRVGLLNLHDEVWFGNARCLTLTENSTIYLETLVKTTPFTITNNLTGVSSDSNNDTQIYCGDNSFVVLNYTAQSGYELPTSVTVTGASILSWDSSDGQLIISNPASNVTITIEGEATFCSVTLNFDLSVTYGCWGDVKVYDGQDATGTLLETINQSTNSSWNSSGEVGHYSYTNTYQISSGYIYIIAHNNYFPAIFLDSSSGFGEWGVSGHPACPYGYFASVSNGAVADFTVSLGD